jgi:hypothetical protein
MVLSSKPRLILAQSRLGPGVSGGYALPSACELQQVHGMPLVINRPSLSDKSLRRLAANATS